MANSTITNGQSCLEQRGMEARHEELVRRKYNKEEPYSATHPDALSDGDVNGKGTGGSHSAWQPNCQRPKNYFDYSNFNTTTGGGLYDIEGRNGIGGRKKALASQLYNQDNEYSANLIETSANIADGQVRLSW